MTSPSFDDIRRMVEELRHLDADERSERLRSCDDEALRQEVASLLEYGDRASEMLPDTVEDVTAIEIALEPDAAMETFDRYRIIRHIGTGGMGIVYEAEQDSPSRRVALKVLAPFSSADVQHRFEMEGELLAKLQHPGIARVYDTGCSDAGSGSRPFIAMELVKGTDVRTHARDLEIRERLEILARIADAVEHAHVRGVIHRDLKPGNILVDESGQPVVLDFGIARVVRDDAEQTRPATQAGVIVGTLAYMSPEQASGDPTKVDARSDVYALGVIAHEMLSGELPIDVGSLPLPRALAAIQDTEPRPLGTVHRQLAGDVETIVQVAMQKDPDRRYQSARDFAGDIRSFLVYKPITARPPSVIYEFKRFVMRHRLPVALTGIALLALLAGGVAATIGLVRALEAEDRERKGRTRAEEALADTEEVNAFLDQLVDDSNRGNTDGKELSFREALDRASARLEETVERPLVRARIHHTFGRDYDALGHREEAVSHHRRGFELRRKHLGLTHGDTVRAAADLAATYVRNIYDLDAAGAFLESVLPHMIPFAADHPWSIAKLVHNRGLLAMYRGNLDVAERRTREAMDIATAGGVGGVLRAEINANLAAILRRLNRARDAEPYLRTALKITEDSEGADSHRTTAMRQNLALNLKAQGRLDEAEPMLRRALEARRRLFDQDNSETLVVETNYGSLLIDLGQLKKATEILNRSVTGHRKTFGPRHRTVGYPLVFLGRAEAARGRVDEAIAAFKEASDLWSEAMAADHPRVITLAKRLADELRTNEEWEAALQVYRRAEEGVANEGRDHLKPLLPPMRLGMSICIAQLGDVARARKLATAITSSLKEGSVLTARGHLTHGEIDLVEGDDASATACMRRAIAAAVPKDPRSTARAHLLLADLLRRAKKTPEAIELLRGYVEKAQERFGGEHWYVRHAVARLADLHEIQGNEAEAAVWRARLQ